MSLLITLNLKHGTPPTSADADALPTLSNTGGTAGIIRNDTQAVVVAAGTAFTRLGLGQYVYELTGVEPGVTYTAYRRMTLDGVTQTRAKEYTASPLATLPSYLLLAEADAIAAGMTGLSAFSARPPTERVQLLAQATMRVDTSRRWQGRKYDEAQALEFPRVPFADYRVWDRHTGSGAVIVPTQVRMAVMFEAASIADGRRDEIAAAIDAGLTGQTTGSVSEQYRQVIAGQAGVTPLCRDAEMLMSKYVLESGSYL